MNSNNNINHNFKKNFGQNFLTDLDKLTEFVELMNLCETDLVIEIGPGAGALTELMLDKCDVISYEIDQELIPKLELRFLGNNRFKLINDDFLSVNVAELVDDNLERSRILFTGSLPYNISKKIIGNILKQFPKYHNIDALFLIQKEVAEDYIADSPKATFLSNMVKVYSEATLKLIVSKDYFFPIPKVDAGIVVFKNKKVENANLKDFEKFIKFIKLGFNHPRKTLFNNLKSTGVKLGTFKNICVNERIRPAEIDFSTWEKLYISVYD